MMEPENITYLRNAEIKGKLDIDGVFMGISREDLQEIFSYIDELKERIIKIEHDRNKEIEEIRQLRSDDAFDAAEMNTENAHLRFEIIQLKAAMKSTVSEIESENTRLRAALAHSDQPCSYCSLPADEIAKCKSGFPGCGRADDMMGCPHLGAAWELQDRNCTHEDGTFWVRPTLDDSIPEEF